MMDRDNRTFICSVVYYDIANYTTKSVEVQIRLKDQLNRFTTEAIKNVAVNDRIILDTGDGAAICFLGDPEDALFVAMSLRDAVLSTADQFNDDPLLVRFGINLGAVKVVNDINNQKNIIGDGINVGQRIMSFAEPGQILVSRSYYEVVSRLTQEYATLFHYLGTRADKHVRQHEIYAILLPSEQANAVSAAESSTQNVKIPPRKKNTIKNSRIAPPNSTPALKQNPNNDIWRSSSVSVKHRRWWQTKKFAYGGITAVIFLAVILSFAMHRHFGGGEMLLDKTALSPEVISKNPDKSPQENTQSTENISPGQTESAMPASAVPNTIPRQQESPDKSPPENSLTKESDGPDQTESATPALPVPPTILQQESPGELPPETPLPKENDGSDKMVRPHAVPSAPDATIQFAITPWGEVFVDGKRLGASPPLTSLAIAPGKHVIEVINTAFPPFSQTIEIDSNEQLKFSHKFK
jgi:class 3 adenylate cyclase